MLAENAMRALLVVLMTIAAAVALPAATSAYGYVELAVVYVGNTMVDLSWTESDYADFAKYEILRDDQPIVTISDRSTTFYRDEDLDYEDSHTYLLRLYYRDGDQLRSMESYPVSATLGRVSGTITQDTTWSATDHSTYLITDDVYIGSDWFSTTIGVKVAEGTTLTIRSGVTVRHTTMGQSATCLHVAGSLEAADVTFTTESGQKSDYGVHVMFEQHATGRLSSCTIERANTGIWCCHADPEISGCTVAYNGVGINMQAGSPTIEGCTISDNSVTGLSIYQGASPVITGNAIINNRDGISIGPSGASPVIHHNDIWGNRAFDVGNPSPSVIDVRNNFWCSATGPCSSGMVNFEPMLEEHVMMPCDGDLAVSDILVVQAIEGGKLVEGKETAVRVFVTDMTGAGTVRGVNAVLYVDGVEFQPDRNNKTIYSDPHMYSVRDRINCEDTFNFHIGKLDAGTHTLRAVVDPGEQLADQNRQNNEVTEDVLVTDTVGLRHLFRQIVSPGYPNSVPLSAFIGEAGTFFANTYPISPDEYHTLLGQPHTPGALSYTGLQLAHYLNRSRITYNANNNPNVDFVIGVVPAGYLGNGVYGQSYRGARRAPLVTEDSPESLAHEIGHFYGLGDEYSSWVEEQITGKVTLGKVIYNQTVYDGSLRRLEYTVSGQKEYYNFMGNAGLIDGWVDEPTYNHLYHELVTGQVDPDPRVIFISGMIYEDDTVELDPSYVFETETEAVEPGDYAVKCLAGDGSVLSEVSFAAGFEDQEASPFALLVPCPEETEKVVVCNESAVLEEVITSANPPTVSIVAPSAGESPSGTYEVAWAASDPDGDDLSYTLLHSSDGINWVTVALDLDQETCAVDLGSLPGGLNCLFKVLATDGFNTVEAVSDGFSVEDQGPSVAVIAPEDGSTVAPGAEVVLQGYAYDMEDGEIDGASLSWESSLDGVLGAGEYLQLSSLSEGTHQITLTAQDSSASTGSDTISLSVVEDRVPPTISSVNLSRSEVELGGNVTVTAVISDNIGVDPASVTVTVGDVVGYLSYAGDSELYEGMVQAPLAEGDYEVIVSAVDLVGNPAASEVITLSVEVSSGEDDGLNVPLIPVAAVVGAVVVALAIVMPIVIRKMRNGRGY
jgi:parallel beta-helix repeat protein